MANKNDRDGAVRSAHTTAPRKQAKKQARRAARKGQKNHGVIESTEATRR